MSSSTDLYASFDNWTKRTGVLDGSGLTWVVRLPLDIILFLVSLLLFAAVTIIHRISKKSTTTGMEVK